MKVALILLAVSAVVFLATVTLRMLVQQWKELPHFYWNYVGGVLAICGVRRYHEAVAQGSFVKRSGKESLVLVPETIIFTNRQELDPYSAGKVSTSSGEDWYLPEFFSYFARRKFAPLLFVPFGSERSMKIEEQKSVFKPEERTRGVEAFDFEERRHNVGADWRLRVVEGGKFDLMWFCVWFCMWFCGGAACLLVFVVGFLLFDHSDKERQKQAVAVHYTDPRSTDVKSIQTTVGNQYRLGMYRTDYHLVKGVVENIQPIGGGLAAVCLKQGEARLDCGIAQLNRFVGGEVAYVVNGEVKSFSVGDLARHFFTNRWIVTESEGDSLLATGQFYLSK